LFIGLPFIRISLPIRRICGSLYLYITPIMKYIELKGIN
jgi:hypothetical protein